MIQNNAPRTYVVTGAAGFLGSHIVQRLLMSGDGSAADDDEVNVIGIDDFSSSKRSSAHHKRLLENHRYRFFEGSINDLTPSRYQVNIQLVRAISNDSVRGVFNMACPASPPVYQAKADHTMKTCSVGLMNMLGYMNPGAFLLQASTSEVYGDPVGDGYPRQDEDYWGNVNPYGPRSCYDEGKRFAEAICFEARRKGQDARLVRIFNTYGPHMNPDDGRVVTNFLKQAHSGQDITIYGQGNQSRSMCFVSDLIDGIMKVAFSTKEHYNGPVNIGNQEEFTMMNLALMVRDMVSRRGLSPKLSKLVLEPLPQDDPRQRCPSLYKAFSMYEFAAKVALADGLETMYTYMVHNGEL